MSELFRRTSNTAVVVVEEKTTRTAINNFEAHIKQVVLSGNAMEEYQRYNYSFPTDFDNQRFRAVINEHLKKGTKYDKSKLSKTDFWVGRTYKRGSGKSTTYVESMTICPPFKVHPDQLDLFLKSNENYYFTDIVEFLKNDEKFKDCLFLDFEVHLNEVYIPESITLEDGTEKMLSEDERWDYAYIKPHMHIAYIPTVKAYDEKTGSEYLKLSRKDLWHSDKGFSHSYSEFIDRKYAAVDKEYGLERGQLYEEMPEEEKPVHMGLEEWKRKNDQARIDRLIHQQEQENQKAIQRLNDEVAEINKQQSINEDVAESLEKGFQEMISDMVDDFDSDFQKVDYVFLKAEKKMLLQALELISKIIMPLSQKYKGIFDRINQVINGVKEKIQSNDVARDDFNTRKEDLEK